MAKGLRLGAGAGALGYGLKRAFINPAAQFERFETVLKTIEGSSEKARESMNWIDDFAVKTPYELAQVTDAFVKLRAYGMNPTDGLLRDLGDASAAMGKPLMQAVEAIADAVTGENERLKEFGVKSPAPSRAANSATSTPSTARRGSPRRWPMTAPGSSVRCGISSPSVGSPGRWTSSRRPGTG